MLTPTMITLRDLDTVLSVSVWSLFLSCVALLIWGFVRFGVRKALVATPTLGIAGIAALAWVFRDNLVIAVGLSSIFYLLVLLQALLLTQVTPVEHALNR